MATVPCFQAYDIVSATFAIAGLCVLSNIPLTVAPFLLLVVRLTKGTFSILLLERIDPAGQSGEHVSTRKQSVDSNAGDILTY